MEERSNISHHHFKSIINSNLSFNRHSKWGLPLCIRVGLGPDSLLLGYGLLDGKTLTFILSDPSCLVLYTPECWYILAELNCREQAKLDISAIAEREVKRQKRWEVILKKVISRQDVRLFCFTSLGFTLFICEVGIIVAPFLLHWCEDFMS